MDMTTLKKKLSSYKSDKGYLKNVSDDVLYEVLIAWENWTGPSAEFYRSLGFTYKQMAGLVGRAKKMKREGHFGSGDFKQIHVEVAASIDSEPGPCTGIEIIWSDGKVIRFKEVDRLIEFLKKVA
ncbi:MAG: hypothetical protein NTX25_03945 [Proteobacteria bacterium]|nr:hypothetical protein [Pseudomonadota bacterium]